MTFKENKIIYYNNMNVIKVQYIQHYLLQNIAILINKTFDTYQYLS